MFQFVYWLKAIAAGLITNSHYSNIWPVSAIAMGGHIGNCLYFFLSGFCLYNIKDSFPVWYLKRIIRIYPALWIVNIIDLMVGRTNIGEIEGVIHCFLYPTWFHFIGSIMVLYIVYYIVRMVQIKLKIDIKWFMICLAICYFLIYILIFDKGTYHIDDVNEKWVRFMFCASMLLGLAFREQYNKIVPEIKIRDIIIFLGLTILFFVGKLALSSFSWLSTWQCFLPVILVCYICSISNLFIKMEKQGIFLRINQKISNVIKFIAEITLEIYLGQTLIIWWITGLPFPFSFIVVTGVILVYAWLIHKCSKFVQVKISAVVGLNKK